jgi:hypothetical protein
MSRTSMYSGAEENIIRSNRILQALGAIGPEIVLEVVDSLSGEGEKEIHVRSPYEGWLTSHRAEIIL